MGYGWICAFFFCFHCGMMSNSMSDREIIGVDFGGTSVKLGVVLGDEILMRAPAISTQEYGTAEALIDAIAQSIEMIKNEYPHAQTVGMGVPGFTHFFDGTVSSLTNVSGWLNVPLRKLLEERVKLPVVVENDANCMAYAEWKCGAGKGMDHLVCLTLGTGVGSGIIVNGGLLRGFLCAAGELGQTSIDYQGRIGHYGNRGALEDYVGNRELAIDARALYASYGIDRNLDDCGPIPLEKSALAGDPVALEVWDSIAQKLSTALVNCCYLLNPEAIIIGGGVAKAKSLLFDPLNSYLQAQLFPPHFEVLKVLPARFGSEAGLIGAAHLAYDTFKTEL